MSAQQPATPRWICAELPPAAVFGSESGKTFSLLFSVDDFKAIRARYPKRYDDWSQVPAALASKTQLGQQGLAVERLGLSPVAEVRHMTPRGAVFVPLYRRPLTLAVARTLAASK